VKRKILPLLTALLVAGVAAYAGEYKGAKVEKGATIKGVVKFAGDASKANQKDTTDKDPDDCGKERVKPELIVNGGGLADAVVFLKKAETGKDWTDAQKKIVLDQQKCAFEKHVTLVAEGGEVVFKNSDKVLHNIKFSSTNNGTFNESVTAGGEKAKKFEKNEFITLSCSVHPWMNATIVVMPHPYYEVTSNDGHFEMKDVPAGKHVVMVQHQVLGKLDKKGMEVEVKEGETKELTFEFK
jgi:plastocyanin